MVDQQYLLNDEGVQNFIKNGYITVHPDLPDVHAEIYRKTAAIFEKEGDPRNHILQKVPELCQVFAHPTVRGVLTSLLGPNYMMHPHRHAHMKQPGTKRWCWHQDGRSKHFTTKDHGWLFEWRATPSLSVCLGMVLSTGSHRGYGSYGGYTGCAVLRSRKHEALQQCLQ